MVRSRAALRYLAAFLLLSYGLAKLDGVQFAISTEQLDRPMGAVSGFWLTWYYYGYSHVYAEILGSIQLLSGSLFLFRRTALLAAMITTPVVLNIFLIDIFFRISWIAAAIAAYLIVVCALCMFESRNALVRLLWVSQPREPNERVWLRWSIRGGVAILAIGQAIVEIMRSQ